MISHIQPTINNNKNKSCYNYNTLRLESISTVNVKQENEGEWSVSKEGFLKCLNSTGHYQYTVYKNATITGQIMWMFLD